MLCSSCHATSLELSTIKSMETLIQAQRSGDGLNRHKAVLGHYRDMPVDRLLAYLMSLALLALTLLYKSAELRLRNALPKRLIENVKKTKYLLKSSK